MVKRAQLHFLTLLLLAGNGSSSASPQSVAKVLIDSAGRVRIMTTIGSRTTIALEDDQIRYESVQKAPDGETVGWLADFESGDLEYAGGLIVWRRGKVIRRFSAEQSFWSWAFYAGGRQVAYHDGPLHGETSSHCELRDVLSGRLLAHWNGDLNGQSMRPAWTRRLNH